jgi:predicted transcriptional regulator
MAHAMTKEQIEAVFERIRTWPEDWQDDAVQAFLRLEQDYENPFELTEEEERELNEGLAEIERGEVVPESEMEAFFAQFR